MPVYSATPSDLQEGHGMFWVKAKSDIRKDFKTRQPSLPSSHIFLFSVITTPYVILMCAFSKVALRLKHLLFADGFIYRYI